MNDNVLARVMKCVMQIVLDDVEIEPDTPLPQLPSMDSLAIYELLDAVECALGCSLPPERIITETFTTPKSIAAAFADGHA